MASKIKKGDTVIVLTGRSKGVTGKVIRVSEKNKRVFVGGVNLVKKHVKPNPQKEEAGGIKEVEAPIHVSNIALVLPKQKGDASRNHSKVGFKTLEDGRKVRYFKYNDELIDAR